MLKFDFKVVKDDKGTIIGFSLEPGVDFPSETYSNKIPQLLNEDLVEIIIEGDKINFINKKQSNLNLTFSWIEEELKNLRRFLLENKRNLVISDANPYSMSNPGFKLTKKE